MILNVFGTKGSSPLIWGLYLQVIAAVARQCERVTVEFSYQSPQNPGRIISFSIPGKHDIHWGWIYKTKMPGELLSFRPLTDIYDVGGGMV